MDEHKTMIPPPGITHWDQTLNAPELRLNKPHRHVRGRTPWPVVAFFASFLVPVDFHLGGLAFTPTRLLLLASCVAFLPRLLLMRSSLVDVLLYAHVTWTAISFAVNEGITKALEAGGIYAAEILGPYSAARVLIKKPEQAIGVIRVLLIAIIATIPFGLVEFMTGYRYTGLFGGPTVARDMRLGFYRVHGPFVHPILYGCFCASAAGLFLYARKINQSIYSHLYGPLAAGAIIAGTFIALTSGGLLSLIAQASLSAWDRLLQTRRKWMVLCAVCFLCYLAVSAVSDRPAHLAILSRVTFSTHTMYYRTIIFEHGMQNIFENPLLGIGFGDWARPSWMHSSSVDNFWLLVAMRHGIPAFTLLLLAFAKVMLPINTVDMRAKTLLQGIRISLFGLALAGATVHLWGPILSHFAFLLGLAEAIRLYAARGMMAHRPEMPASTLDDFRNRTLDINLCE